MEQKSMNETAELRACPFCGGEASLSQGLMGADRYEGFYVECCDCAASCEMFPFKEKDRAILQWNRRTGSIYKYGKDLTELQGKYELLKECSIKLGEISQITLHKLHTVEAKYERALAILKDVVHVLDHRLDVQHDSAIHHCAKELLREIE